MQNPVAKSHSSSSMAIIYATVEIWYVDCGHPSHIGNPYNWRINLYWRIDDQSIPIPFDGKTTLYHFTTWNTARSEVAKLHEDEIADPARGSSKYIFINIYILYKYIYIYIYHSSLPKQPLAISTSIRIHMNSSSSRGSSMIRTMHRRRQWIGFNIYIAWKPHLVGGWTLPLKNDGLRQLGSWHSQPDGKS